MLDIPAHWNLLENRVVWISIAAWFIAQSIKFIIDLSITHRPDWKLFVSQGGMPSSHCSLVAGMTTSVGIVLGLNSVLFAVCAVLSMIVIYDAAGVRRTVGIQSTILNRMLEELFKGNPLVKQRLREFIGHSRWEVVAGIGLGVLIGWLGCLGL
ncbi:MAG: divergent PAP2 family protein [Chloroflexota bacterium]